MGKRAPFGNVTYLAQSTGSRNVRVGAPTTFLTGEFEPVVSAVQRATKGGSGLVVTATGRTRFWSVGQRGDNEGPLVNRRWCGNRKNVHPNLTWYGRGETADQVPWASTSEEFQSHPTTTVFAGIPTTVVNDGRILT